MISTNLAGLKVQVEDFLSKQQYKGFDYKFKIQSLGPSGVANDLYYLAPVGLENSIPRNEQDFGWENRLFNIGRAFDIYLALSPTCYKDRQ